MKRGEYKVETDNQGLMHNRYFLHFEKNLLKLALMEVQCIVTCKGTGSNPQIVTENERKKHPQNNQCRAIRD